VTDDAMLVEQSGVPVVVVAGSQYAVKITTPFDLRIAESLARPDGTMPT
jgi:2-C-methyl-D-erythritol 4-phosphate cytidylyltransferase